MTRLLVTAPVDDPGPEAHSAKNAPTGPGLTNHSGSDVERTTMVENPRATIGSTADRLAVYATPEQVTYEPHTLNALIATVSTREVAGRLRERAAYHRQTAADLTADTTGDLVEECQAAWHRIEAAELDALAARELAGGEIR
jgi:hypothetical protein